ncbi:NADP-dependent oxidoreductase [Nonomuraea sediminis]|uniref:NADP-dependent oxidoreductase n=1 Tax=Nonomuraea sediminis TaxID=2835864 RepID=UPI001BDC7C23|nr:NADP-dependent oxidoreductase [Nonomuraea sediminis]
MQAISQSEYGGPEVLEQVEVARPEPLPTEVLVRVHAAGVNPVDWKTRAGGGMAGVLGEPPFILGWDVSGVVEEVGFGVTRWKPGDEVYGMPWFPRAAGAYAEYVTAPARQFARKPATISHEQAGAVPLAALTAWQALVDTAKVEAGQRVLILAGAGGVGHLAIQFARHLGAYVITTSTAGKHGWLRELGAAETVDYTTTAFDEVVRDVDVVLDLVGDGHRSLKVLRPDGLLVAIPSGVSPDLLDSARTLGVRATPFLVEPDGTALARIADLIDREEVAVEVEAVLPLEHAAEAHRRGEQGHTRGKIVLSLH